MILYYTTKDRVCGSFTAVSWESEGGEKEDHDAFLFSLDRRLKFPVRNPEHAIFCRREWGPTFGLENDLSARHSPFNKEDNGTSTGSGVTYIKEKKDAEPADLLIKLLSGGSASKAAVSPLTGTNRDFTIVKMEVYKVSF